MPDAQGSPTFAWPTDLSDKGYVLRPEADADIPFLIMLYGSTREVELAAVPWTPDQKQAFIRQQFNAQRHHYKTAIKSCSFDVIERRGELVGRLYIEIRQTQWSVVDIALLPSFCGKGIGRAILEAIIAAAAAEGKGVGVFVEKFNPAQRLYRRLGFTEIADAGAYWEMERVPAEVGMSQLNKA